MELTTAVALVSIILIVCVTFIICFKLENCNKSKCVSKRISLKKLIDEPEVTKWSNCNLLINSDGTLSLECFDNPINFDA